MNRAEKCKQLRAYLNQIASEGGIERLADEPEALERMAPRGLSGAPESEEERARAAARAIILGEEIDDEEMFLLEAIILPEGRPVIDIVEDSFSAPPSGLWSHLGEASIRSTIEAAIPSVGRIELPLDPRLPFGGTGFVVGPGLVMTNRHVAELFARGVGIQQLRFRPGQAAGVDFKQERRFAEPILVDVREIAMIHPYWDMALLRVEGLREPQRALSLSIEHARELEGVEVAVVGYPAFDSRNNTALQNRIFDGVFNVKRLQPGKLNGRESVRSFGNVVLALKHDASTLGGNSGSAVVRLDTGEVVALHFAGLYKESNWAVPTYELARDSFVVDAGVNFSGSLGKPPFPWLSHWREADPIDESGGAATAVTGAPTVDAAAGVATWRIPLEITVSLGAPARADAAVQGGAVADAEVEKPPTRPDPDYSNRRGYDPGFLGHGHEIKIPWLTDEQYANVAINRDAATDRHVLPYHHFSVVMNRERRVAYFTAVNMDGRREMDVPRSDFRDFWSPDPRVDDDAFLDNDFYRDVGDDKNPLDRGHLVRRLDPCWGASLAEVHAANHDTFHWTNCSPQHKSFNRNKTTWGGVENHILNGANNHDLKVSVFTGPVFRDDDPVYITPTHLRVRIPLDYWKVVVMVKPDGRLSATGFVISQSDVVDDMIEFAFTDEFEQFQTTVRSIEEMTGLSFRGLADHDPLAGTEEAVGAGPVRIPMSSYRSVVIE